jgi:hypothetical protein
MRMLCLESKLYRYKYTAVVLLKQLLTAAHTRFDCTATTDTITSYLYRENDYEAYTLHDTAPASTKTFMCTISFCCTTNCCWCCYSCMSGYYWCCCFCYLLFTTGTVITIANVIRLLLLLLLLLNYQCVPLTQC